MSHDFTTMRVRRDVLAHARELEAAIRRAGVDNLPPEVREILAEGGVSAITDASYQLLAKLLKVELEPPGRNGTSGA